MRLEDSTIKERTRKRRRIAAFLLLAVGFAGLPLGGSVVWAWEYGAVERRDPFVSLLPKAQPQQRPQPQLEEAAPEFEISGLVWTGRKLQAVVNDEVVGIGQNVKGYEVLAIEKTGVKLRKGKREVYLNYSPTL